MQVPTLDSLGSRAISSMAVFSIKAIIDGVEKTGNKPDPTTDAVSSLLTISCFVFVFIVQKNVFFIRHKVFAIINTNNIISFVYK